MILDSQQQHSKRMRNSVLRKRAGSLLEETATTTEHMTTALSQLFFPWRSPSSPAHTAVQRWIPPCGHRGVRLSSAEEKEWGGVSEGGEIEERRKKKRGSSAAVRNEQPKICSACTVNSSSDCDGLTATAEVGSMWVSSVLFTPSALRQ